MLETINEVGGLTFSYLNAKQILQKSVVIVDSTDKKGAGTVYDQRLGFEAARDRCNGNTPCETCNRPLRDCTGHMGAIELAKHGIYCINPILTAETRDFLDILCHQCGSPFLRSIDQLIAEGIHVPDELMDSEGGDDGTSDVSDRVQFMDEDGIELFKTCLKAVKASKKGCSCGMPRTQCVFSTTEHTYTGYKVDSEGKSRVGTRISEEEIYTIFSRVDLKLLKFIGIDTDAFNPLSCFLDILPVIPPAARTPVEIRAGEMSEDSLSTLIPEILKIVQKYKALPADKELSRQKLMNLINKKMRALVFNKNNVEVDSNNNPYFAILNRVNGNGGQSRSKWRVILARKRVNHSARTVITCDPCLDADEIGIPQVISHNTRKKRRVQAYNINMLQKCLNHGLVKYVERDGRRIRIEYVTWSRGTTLDPRDLIVRKVWASKVTIANHPDDLEKYLIARQRSLRKLFAKSPRLIVRRENNHVQYLKAPCTSPDPATGKWVEIKLSPFESDCMLIEGDLIEIETDDGETKRVKVSIPRYREFKLMTGDVVHRRLMTGDIVIINRQPTLHTNGFVACRAHILNDKIYDNSTRGLGNYSQEAKYDEKNMTIRMSPQTVEQLNADFDGDELSLHFPSTLEAEAECRYILSVSKMMISQENHMTAVGPIQDSVLSEYIMSKEDAPIEKVQLMDAAMQVFAENKSGTNSDDWHGVKRMMQLKEICESLGVPYLSSRTMLALCFPHDFEYTGNGIEIRFGRVISGIIRKKNLRHIGHIVSKYYGQDAGCVFSSNIQRVTCFYMNMTGFSLGLKDCIDDEHEEIRKHVYERIVNARNEELSITDPTLREQRVQLAMTQITNVGVGLVSKHLKAGNRLAIMQDSGSKGKPINLCQIMAVVGQQIMEGKRLKKTMNNGTRYTAYAPMNISISDPNVDLMEYYRQNGAIFNSLMDGLTLEEYIFFAATGRSGVCDTVLKTATSGYIERRMVTILSNIVVRPDGTLRNNRDRVITLAFNDDNIDAASSVVVSTDKEEDRLQFADLQQMAQIINCRTKIQA